MSGAGRVGLTGLRRKADSPAVHLQCYEVPPRAHPWPELTNGPRKTHKGTERERSGVGPVQIRRIRVSVVNRGLHGDDGKQMSSVTPKKRLRLAWNPKPDKPEPKRV